MKIGVCAPPEKLPLLESLGYDYFEANFSWLAGLDEETYRQMTALVEASSLRAEAFNGFFPGGITLYSPNGNQDDILPEVEAFCEKGFARAAAWGGKVAVIGSGYVRGIPKSMTWEECDVQFSRVFAVCARVAAKYGITRQQQDQFSLESHQKACKNALNNLSRNKRLMQQLTKKEDI